jgi:putative transposase
MFVAGDGAKWVPSRGRRWAQAAFQAVGSVKVRQHRQVTGTVKTLQLKQEHRRWYVIVTADTEPVPLLATGHAVGVDMGVARFLTTSDGEVIANPRFLAASADVIADLQRRKVRNRRRDFHHKTARALVNSCDAIGLEDLNTAGMTRRPSARPDGQDGWLPNGAAAKAGLAKSILDAGWAQFTSILAAKAEEAGRRVILVNPAYTSIDCHACGQRCTRPRRDTVICIRCGPHDADLNGARNIYARAGLGSGQAATTA